jgi:hypothetical protein
MLENWGRLVNVSAPREVLPLTHCAVLLSHGGISPEELPCDGLSLERVFWRQADDLEAGVICRQCWACLPPSGGRATC